MKLTAFDQHKFLGVVRTDVQSRRVSVDGSFPTNRVWETQTWTCEKWSNLAGACQVNILNL